MSILLFLIILVVLVWVHELGHFVAAKLFGIRVDSFNIGFGPVLFSRRVGETLYAFRPILVGGYVSIHGEDPSAAAEASQDKRALTSKSRPVQAAVVLAGVLFNVLFAWLVLTGGYMHGLQSTVAHEGYGQVTGTRATIVGVLPGSPADKAGVKGGDTVLSVQTGTSQLPEGVEAGAVHDFLTSHVEESIALRLMRGGVEKDFIVKADEGVVAGRKALGVELDDVGTLALPPHLAALQAGIVSKNILQAEAGGLADLFKRFVVGQGSLDGIAGPIGIVSIGSQLVSQGFDSAVTVIAFISINLALINVLPIPGLDGGRLLFIIIESVIRRPLNQRMATALTVAGFVFIIGLLLLISVHDISRLVG